MDNKQAIAGEASVKSGFARRAGIVIAAALLSACGGGGGGAADPVPPPVATVTAQSCAPTNPYRADASAATSLGSLDDEKTWLRDYVERQYLWFGEMPTVDASLPAYSSTGDVYGALDAYFTALKTPARTSTGKLKDEFSFSYPTRQWDDLINSGSFVGYGIEWAFVSDQVPRNIRIAFVHTGSAAEAQGLQRGDTLVSADGVSVNTNTQSGLDALYASLYPASGGAHSFSFSRSGTSINRSLNAGAVTLTAASAPTVLPIAGQNVGYLLFNDHLLTAEQPLINAFTQLRDAGVSDLVLDLRYNSGGYVFLASEVAYMIAGAARTTTATNTGKVFERLVFNSKRQAENTDTPFFNQSCLPNSSFNCTNTSPLPTLNLPRVFILTSASTCSASEAIINGLRGVDVDVRLVGGTSCGKPYGFYGQDNCGVSYFPIEFKGVNAKGFGEYADGFVPGGSGGAANNVAGCTARDDLNRALGDPAEGQLAAALFLRANGTCPPVAAGREGPLSAGPSTTVRVPKATVRSQRIGRMPGR